MGGGFLGVGGGGGGFRGGGLTNGRPGTDHIYKHIYKQTSQLTDQHGQNKRAELVKI